MKHIVKRLKNISVKDLAKNKGLIIFVLVAFVIFESISLFQIRFTDIFSPTDSAGYKNYSLNQFADKILAECADTGYHPTCYDKQIPKLMDYISMEDAFKVTRIVQDKDSSYPYCHVLAHELSAREVGKNPDGWKDVVSRCPSGMCSNGCIHGGFQERFRAETFTETQINNMKPELSDLCEARENWKPTGLEQASCYHALGHLTMYLTEADVKKSVGLCNEFTIKSDGRDFSHLCYDGAFMQIYQPLEPEDFSLIEGKEITKDNLVSFCKQFRGEQYGSCWSESWPLFRAELEKPEGLVSYCSQSIPAEIDRCYDATVYVISAQFGLSSAKILDYCPGLPGLRQGRCFANAASRMIETDYRNIAKAVDLCTSAEPYDKNNQCFNELLMYSGYNYHQGSEEHSHVCNALPDPWKTKCFSRSR